MLIFRETFVTAKRNLGVISVALLGPARSLPPLLGHFSEIDLRRNRYGSCDGTTMRRNTRESGKIPIGVTKVYSDNRDILIFRTDFITT